MSNTTSIHAMNVRLKVLILEDETEIAENIQRNLKKAISAIEAGASWAAVSPLDTPALFTHDVSFAVHDNVQEATSDYQKGNCDLFIADYRVKLTGAEAKATASALSLLRMIKLERAFVPIIGHSAVNTLISEANSEGIVDFPIGKENFSSTKDVILKGTEVAKTMISFRESLLGSFYVLKCAAASEDIIEKQQLLDKARHSFAHVIPPPYAPADYRKTLMLITAITLRMSSIPSTKFQLGQVSFEATDILQPVIYSLAQTKHSYKCDTVPMMQRLEAKGYSVIMRLSEES